MAEVSPYVRLSLNAVRPLYSNRRRRPFSEPPSGGNARVSFLLLYHPVVGSYCKIDVGLAGSTPVLLRFATRLDVLANT